MVRRGLVRCWSCGTFMRQEIADAFERMQNKRPDVEFKPLPERKANQPHGPAGTSRTGVASSSDDDFGFAGTMAPKPIGGDFELGALLHLGNSRRAISGSVGVLWRKP